MDKGGEGDKTIASVVFCRIEVSWIKGDTLRRWALNG